VKEIYGDRMEKYSYENIDHDPKVNKRVVKERKLGKGNYERVRGKVLEFVILAFILFMLSAGVYFIFTSIMAA